MGLSVADILLIKKIKELLEENNRLQKEQLKAIEELKTILKETVR